MTQWKGNILSAELTGKSHDPEMRAVLTGMPAGIEIDTEALAAFMARRAPGKDAWSTPRKEADAVEFLSGTSAADGALVTTTGSPIELRIRNTNTRSGDYAEMARMPRPGHADYACFAQTGHPIEPGGGAFSGRITALLCAVGYLALSALEQRGIHVNARMVEVGGVQCDTDVVTSEIADVIAQAKAEGDSVGGKIRVSVEGVPAGIGGAYFEGLDCSLGSAFFGIPAVKAVEFGAGVGAARMKGSENNDDFLVLSDGRIRTKTNNHGGLLGGITSGMPLVATLTVKPTPSIARAQQSFDLTTHKAEILEIMGRHDPCIVPRAIPVVEAVAGLVVLDALLGADEASGKDLSNHKDSIHKD